MARTFCCCLFVLSSAFSAMLAAGDDNVIIRFGIVTDAHYADANTSGSRFYRESLAKMRECVGKMNQENVGFLVELGDFKDQGCPASEEETLKFLMSIETEFAKFAGPRYHVLGNHDADSISKNAFLEKVDNTAIPKDKSYYSFTRKGIQFIVLDANFKKDGTSYDHGNFVWSDANISKVELDWLKKTLSDHQGKSLVFIHQQLNTEGTAECVTNASAVRKILTESGKVIAVFNGHAHDGGAQKIDGIHYYTLEAMIEGSGPENNAYAIVEVNKDFSLKVTGFRKARSAELK